MSKSLQSFLWLIVANWESTDEQIIIFIPFQGQSQRFFLRHLLFFLVYVLARV